MSQVVARWQYHTTSASQLSFTCLRLFAGGEYFRFSKITQFPLLKYHPPARVVFLQVGNTSAYLISLYFRFSNITHLPASLCRGYTSASLISLNFRFSNITHLPASLCRGYTSASLISLNFRFSIITHLPESLCRGGLVYPHSLLSFTTEN